MARSLFKLMAYKDEYEVARLYTGDAFRAQLQDQFEGEYSLRFHAADLRARIRAPACRAR